MKKQDRFTRYIDDHMKLIWKVSRIYCRNAEERKDLVQDIIIQLWKSFPNYDPIYAFSTWTYRVALNVSISHVRKSTSRQKLMEKYKDHISVKVWDSDQDEGKADKLYDALCVLNPLQKALISLHLDAYPHAEIAKIMGISPSNVSTRLNRIKIILKKHINQQS